MTHEFRKFRLMEMDLPVKSKVGVDKKKMKTVFTPLFVVPEFEWEENIIKDECAIRIKGQERIVVMNLIAEKMKGETKHFRVDRECHQKKVKMKVVAVNKAYWVDNEGEEGEDEEGKEEEDNKDKLEFKREVVVSVGLRRERKMKWNVVYLKKKNGCVEDFYLFVKDVKEIMMNLQ